MGERKKRIGGTGMKWYAIGKTLTPLDRAPESGAAVVLSLWVCKKKKFW